MCKLGFSHRRLAQSHVSVIEAGQTDPRYSTLRVLCQLLGLEITLVPREKALWVDSIINDDYDRIHKPRFLPDDAVSQLGRLTHAGSKFKVIKAAWCLG